MFVIKAASRQVKQFHSKFPNFDLPCVSWCWNFSCAGEIVGDLYKQRLQKVEDTLDKIVALSSEDGKITTLEAAQLNDIRKDLYDLKSEGVDVASLAGGLAAAFAGGDVNTGADAGGNAAENNALCLGICIGIGAAIAAIVVALEVADKVLVAKDAIDLANEYQNCNTGNQTACNNFKQMAIVAGAGAIVEGTVGNLVPGSKVGTEIINWVRKNVDPSALNKVDEIAGLLPAPKFQKHHIMPQKHRAWFERKGINIDDFSVKLESKEHLSGVHGKGGFVGSGNVKYPKEKWNDLWDDYIDKNPGATPKEIYQHAGKLMDQFGLSKLPLEKYK